MIVMVQNRVYVDIYVSRYDVEEEYIDRCVRFTKNNVTFFHYLECMAKYQLQRAQN